MTDTELMRDLWTASWMSKGQPPDDRDKTYWRKESPGMLERGPQINHRSPVFPDFDSGRAYQMDRMLGWQSGGGDVPPYGIWANPPRAFHEVPPFPGEGEPSPTPTPAPAPIPTPAPAPSDAPTLMQIDARLGRIEALLAMIASAKPSATAKLNATQIGQILTAVKALVPKPKARAK